MEIKIFDKKKNSLKKDREKLKNHRLSNWHSWFAWYPVTAEDENGDEFLIWLKKVERKAVWDKGKYCDEIGLIGGYNWEYRVLG